MAKGTVLVILVHLFQIFLVDAVPRVRVSEGNLSGCYLTTRYGRNISAFAGIPFAEPPIGDLRFD